MRNFIILLLSVFLITSTFHACKNKQDTAEKANKTEEVSSKKEKSATEGLLDNMDQQKGLSEKARKDSANADSLLISYERTPCFGQCKTFKTSIYKSGFAIYQGKNFVNNIGNFQGRISEENLESIKSVIEEIDYFSFEPEYDNPNVTDLPSVITEVRMDGKKLKIKNRYQGPKDLNKLYNQLDVILEETEWNELELQN